MNFFKQIKIIIKTFSFIKKNKVNKKREMKSNKQKNKKKKRKKKRN